MSYTITPEERRTWREEHKNWTGRDSDLVVRVRLLEALEITEALLDSSCQETRANFSAVYQACTEIIPELKAKLEAAEAHAAKNADDLRKASAMAIHAETRAEQAEAENARLQKMVEWLAAELSDGCSTSRCIYHGATESCPLECGEHSTGHWQEAARRAVAGGVMTAIPHTIHNNTQPRE